MKYFIERDKQVMLQSGILYLKRGDYESDNKEVIAKLDGANGVKVVKAETPKAKPVKDKK